MMTQHNPNGILISYAVMLLMFILLNPAPEIIYQVQHDSPLDVFKHAYEFVLENWIEWFLPIGLLLLPLVAAPNGLTSFFLLSRRVGRGAGLDFSQILILPFTILGSWLSSFGVDPELAQYVMLLLTPALAVSLLLFRGHLFASLYGSSHRQRQFASQFRRKE
jgi:hypothetical protein